MIPMEEALRWLEENEGYQQIIQCASEGSEGEVQQKVQNYLGPIQKVSWMNKEQFEHLENGVWRAVEARRKGRNEEQEQRRQAQEWHEAKGVVTTQEECAEEKKETNSMHEENDVSNRHMTWSRDAWWVPMDNGPALADGARPSKSVESSHESRAGNARDRMGVSYNGEKRKQHIARRLSLRKRNNSSRDSSSSRRNRSNAGTPVTAKTTGDLKLKEACYRG